MTPWTDDELDRLLYAVDPATNYRDALGQTDQVFEELARSVIAANSGLVEVTRRRARGGRRVRLALVAGLLVAAVGTAAFGYAMTARTGLFGPPTSESDTSEWLRTDAADYREVLEQLVPHHRPLPAGWAWETRTDRFVEVGRKEPAVKQVTGIIGEYAMFAQCAWAVEWLEAHEVDDARAARAVAMLRQVPTWTEIAAIDGGGLRASYEDQAAAAARGDEAFVLEWNQTCVEDFGGAHR